MKKLEKDLKKSGIINLNNCCTYISYKSNKQDAELETFFQDKMMLMLFIEKNNSYVNEEYFNEFFTDFLTLIKNGIIFRYFHNNHKSSKQFKYLNDYLKARIDEYVYNGSYSATKKENIENDNNGFKEERSLSTNITQEQNKDRKDNIADMKKEMRRYKVIRGLITGLLDYEKYYKVDILSKYRDLANTLDVETYDMNDVVSYLEKMKFYTDFDNSIDDSNFYNDDEEIFYDYQRKLYR